MSLLVAGQSPDSSSSTALAAAPPPPSTESDSGSNSDVVLTIVLVSILVGVAAAAAVAIRVTNARKKKAAADAAAEGGRPSEKERLAGPRVAPYEFASYQKDARRLLGNAVPSDYATSNAVSGAMMHMPLRHPAPHPPRPDAPYTLL